MTQPVRPRHEESRAHPVPCVLTFSGVGLTWPDGTVASTASTCWSPPGRSGLVGANGSGKSTLLRLAAGELRPPPARSRSTGEVGYLPQDLTLDRASRVDDFLGIGRRCARCARRGRVR